MVDNGDITIHRGDTLYTTPSFFQSVVTTSLHETPPGQLVREIPPKHLEKTTAKDDSNFSITK